MLYGLVRLPEFQLEGHLRRHDFSRWIERVFRDCPLATHLRTLESRMGTHSTREVTDDIAQAVRARYEMSEGAIAGSTEQDPAYVRGT